MSCLHCHGHQILRRVLDDLPQAAAAISRLPAVATSVAASANQCLRANSQAAAMRSSQPHQQVTATGSGHAPVASRTGTYFAMQALRQHPLALAHYLTSTRLLPKPVVVPGAAAGETVSSSSGTVVRAIDQARRQYNPRPYPDPGRVTWFVNSERAPLAVSQWREFAGEV